MSQQQYQEIELRRSSRRRNRKSYSDYFSDDDVLTEHEEDEVEEQEDLGEEYFQEEDDDEKDASHNSSDNDSGKEEQQSEASLKDPNPKFACGLCSNILSDPYIIPACCHRFCCKCIQQSLKSGIGSCPACRDHSVSFESLRRDDMMGRLLARYEMLQEKIQKKPMEEEKHETEKKRVMESTGKSETRQTNKYDRNKRCLTFDEHFHELQTFKERHGHCIVPKEYKENKRLGAWCSRLRMMKSGTVPNTGGFKLTPERIKRLENMGFRWTTTKTFDEYFHELQAYKEKHGHCIVPRGYKGNKKLGDWCFRLRSMKSGVRHNSGNYKLIPERIKRLEDIGFRWRHASQPLKKVETRVSSSREKLDAVRKMDVVKKIQESDTVESANGNDTQEKHNINSNATNKTIQLETENETKATESTQRKRTHEIIEIIQEESNTNQSRKRKKRKRINRSFDEYFGALQSFKRKKGNCNVTAVNNTEDPSLANWVHAIRAMKAGRMKPYTSPNTKLTKARIAKLDALGFEWTRGPSYQDRLHKFTFEDYVRDLKAYKAKHGDCYVPDTYKDHKKLGHWVSKIRAIRAGTLQPVNRPYLKLTEERITELDSIGFKWRGYKTFDEYMKDLRQFKAKHGHCDVPYRYQEDMSLGSWVGRIRRKKLGKTANNGGPDHKLTNERIVELDKMGFNWRLRL